jgi:HK97 gp10 family phage protein
VSEERTSSLERFRQLTERMKNEVHVEAVRELYEQANNLRDAIKEVTPVYQGPPTASVQPGALKNSVRTIPDKNKDTIVRVAAGDETTQMHILSDKPFDYARAVEFGTQNMPAHPFFFPTYRLMKRRMIAAMRRRLTATIKKYSSE